MPVPIQMLVSVLRRLAWAACTLLPSGASGAVDRSMRLSRQRRNDDTLLLRRAPVCQGRYHPLQLQLHRTRESLC